MANLITPTEYYNKICNRIAVEIAKFTPQLFSVKSHKSTLPPSADSSSILLTVAERFFLITTGHTVHNVDLSCLGLMIGNDFYTIGGQLRYFEPNELDNCDPNKLDMAVFELDSDIVNVISVKYQFLQWNKIGINHSSLTTSFYLIFGYPEQKTRKWFPTKQILPSPLVLRTVGMPQEYYAKEGINHGKTIVTIADQKRVGRSSTKEIEQLPELGGISGCGVWNIFNLLDDKPQFELVSILTGENAEKTVLYSSKVDNLKKILTSQFNIAIPME